MDTKRIVGVDAALGAQVYTNAALSNTPQQVAAPIVGRPRVLYALVLSNTLTGAAISYLQLFNAGSTGAVTLGTTLPTVVVGIPAGQPLVVSLNDVGLRFDAGIVAAVTSSPTGSGAPTTALVATMAYA